MSVFVLSPKKDYIGNTLMKLQSKNLDTTNIVLKSSFDRSKILSIHRNSSLDYQLLKSEYTWFEEQIKSRRKGKPLEFIFQYKDYSLKMTFSKNAYIRELIDAIWSYIVENGSLSCNYCKIPLNSKTFTLDHYIPKYKGGEESEQNYVPSCECCNTNKASIHPHKEVRLYSHFLEYIKTDQSKNLIDYLIDEKNYTEEDYPQIINSLNISFRRKLYLLYRMAIKRVPIVCTYGFDPEIMEANEGLSFEEQKQIKTLLQYLEKQEYYI